MTSYALSLTCGDVRERPGSRLKPVHIRALSRGVVRERATALGCNTAPAIESIKTE